MSGQERTVSRVLRSKEAARATYDTLSRWYDLLAGRFERPYQDVGLQQLKVKEGEHVVEIGFGTGYALVALARAVGSTGQVCGIDLSEGMCRVAEARVRKAHVRRQSAGSMGTRQIIPSFLSGPGHQCQRACELPGEIYRLFSEESFHQLKGLLKMTNTCACAGKRQAHLLKLSCSHPCSQTEFKTALREQIERCRLSSQQQGMAILITEHVTTNSQRCGCLGSYRQRRKRCKASY